FFFFNDTATTEIYTLSLHDALPIFLFFDHEKQVDLILIKLEQDCPSMLLKDYKKWLSQNWSDPRMSIFQSHKIFEQGLKNEKFKLIREGAIVSEGATYEDFKSFLSK
ncbi:MAG TPA: hypothetical protein DHV04_03750, partial [Flavobacteriaceae bacterium]|nr:hypothetical protein [Flavobacteriaceae bacterium]